jgi:NAD(P)H-dependent flavin oxidoreductase YrpB (nitropropane dioxygenase family)
MLGIEAPISQAGMGSFTSPELVAAVSNSGALGSMGASARSVQSLREDLARVRELTDRPFAVNHTVRFLNKEAFALTLEAKPALISLAIDSPGELVGLAHDAGIRVMYQAPTVEHGTWAEMLPFTGQSAALVAPKSMNN